MERPWIEFYETDVPPTIEIPEIPIFKLLDDAVKENPGGTVISYFGKEISYLTLGRYVRQFAIALSRLGVTKGARVAIMLPNIPQYVVAHFAILKLGAIVVPTNPLYVERELESQLNNSGAQTIITLDTFYPRVARIKSATSVRDIIIARANEYLPFPLKMLYPLKARKDGTWVSVEHGPGIHFYHDLLNEKFQVDLPEVEVNSIDTAIFLYTGGTTGISKGAVLTHRNLVANVLQLRAWYCDLEEEREAFLSALPFFHSYGLTTCLHKSILLRCKMVLVPNPRDIKAILKAIESERVTLFPGVPTLFVAINNFPDVGKYKLSSIKGCVSGGAALPIEVSQQFEKTTGGRLVEGYGLSEASPVTHANPIAGKRKEGAIGLPLPSTEAKIVDSKTRQSLPIGEVGELAIRGPQVMSGYWEMEEETKAVLQDGWLYTGDVAKMDADGYFYIVDRQKDMIIAGGFNIYPREIEEVLYQHPLIVEVAVIGVADEYRGETVKAFVVLKTEAEITADAIIAFCRDKLAPFKVPKYVEFRDSLPKSSIGKILKRVLTEEAAVTQSGKTSEV